MLEQENILRPEAPSIHVEDPKLVNSDQKVVGPDPSWIAAENKVNTYDGIPLHAAPVPPPIWSGISGNLPAGWSKGDSIPCSILQAALAAATSKLEQPKSEVPIKEATDPNHPDHIWAETEIIEDDDKPSSEDEYEIEVINVKENLPIPGLGKMRANPVKPSLATVSACKDSDDSVTDPYACNSCSFTAERATTLFRHMKSVHDHLVPDVQSDPLMFLLIEQNEAIMTRMNEQDAMLKETLDKVNKQQMILYNIYNKGPTTCTNSVKQVHSPSSSPVPADVGCSLP